MSGPNSDQSTLDRSKEGVDAAPASIDIAKATFLGSSRVISTSTIQKKKLVDEDLVPIKIEKIRGNYTLLMLVFIN